MASFTLELTRSREYSNRRRCRRKVMESVSWSSTLALCVLEGPRRDLRGNRAAVVITHYMPNLLIIRHPTFQRLTYLSEHAMIVAAPRLLREIAHARLCGGTRGLNLLIGCRCQ